MKKEKEVKENFLKVEELMSEYATKSSAAIRLEDMKEDIRPPFFHDSDRIIHALSYNRYTAKTQVFSFKENDHISRRMVHVQFVSKIARTICRALRLNTDLAEAIALGHDVGHTPLGHLGESLLNEISKRELNEYFSHNIQSVRHYMEVENNGLGLNLTLQTLDGIMCHNGEILSNKYVPMKKDINEFKREYLEAYKDLKTSRKYSPMTLEGCVVRISDIIAYIGRDIEDAINLGKLNRCDIPIEITKVLGQSNKEIINTIILDIIENSLNKPYIEMSEEVYQALLALKKFNYTHIYEKSATEKEKEYYRTGMNKIYHSYLKDIEEKNENSLIYQVFLKNQSRTYLENTQAKRMVLDFIAGMTDNFFLREIKKLSKN